jgi:replicative DNA helicase
MVETVLTQASRSSSCDIRIVYEKVRERLPDVQFHQVSDIYTLIPIASALGEFVEIVRSTAKRRALLGLLTQAGIDLADTEIPTAKLISDLAMQADSLSHELSPPRPMDTKNLLMDAIKRYETGDDQTQRIRTGFEKIDNLSPIRYGDFVVIGGETKSGKTMLALNIIANLL